MSLIQTITEEIFTSKFESNIDALKKQIKNDLNIESLVKDKINENLEQILDGKIKEKIKEIFLSDNTK